MDWQVEALVALEGQYVPAAQAAALAALVEAAGKAVPGAGTASTVGTVDPPSQKRPAGHWLQPLMLLQASPQNLPGGAEQGEQAGAEALE